MNIWKRLNNLIGRKASAPVASASSAMRPPSMPEDEPEIVVPEVTVAQLQALLSEDTPPLVIDVREPYEWRLVRMADALHIPMNDVPSQIDSLPQNQPIVVMCAHGSRSYSVAAWLIEQGFDASSLEGGITEWARQGCKVDQTPPQ